MTRRTALVIALGGLAVVLIAIVVAVLAWPRLPDRTLPAAGAPLSRP